MNMKISPALVECSILTIRQKSHKLLSGRTESSTLLAHYAWDEENFLSFVEKTVKYTKCLSVIFTFRYQVKVILISYHQF